MAVSITREGWVELFVQRRSPNMFLSRFFTVKPGGFYNGDKVAIDIQRFGEQVALVVQRCSGPRLNDISVFTTKEFTPPSYAEAVPFDVCDLVNRLPGVDPYSAAYTEYSAQLLTYMMQGFALMDDKIKRSIELQASQILQYGKLDLTDDQGNVLYNLDFSPKASHFPQCGVTPGYGPVWSAGGTNLINDLQTLADTIRADGKITPDKIIMGQGALRNFLDNDAVKEIFDNRRIDIGEVEPRLMDAGATFQGMVWVSNYPFQLWGYPETYEDPVSGDSTKFVEDDKVIMLSSKTRLDKVSARVPLPLGVDPRFAGFLPGRVTDMEAGLDVTPNVYGTPNGKQITGELESRTLLIPVQIDGFGALKTEA